MREKGMKLLLRKLVDRLLARGEEHGVREDLQGYLLDPERGDPTNLLTPNAQVLSRRLMTSSDIDGAAYDRSYRAIFETGRELIIGQSEYGPQHRARFRELFNAVDVLVGPRDQPQVLEFGASEFTALYGELFPNVILEVSDRPTPPGYIGFTREAVERIANPLAYYSIDLQGGAAAIAESELKTGGYDLIVLAEVLEHLDVHPVELVEALLGRLKPDGYLYLTTPNFFRRENLQKLARLDNPQPWFPRQGGNWDAHHHHREYAPRELVEIIREAGGGVAAFHYSDCWETEPNVPMVEWSSLVVVAEPVVYCRENR
jgi:SAM-dependent methyltransferase